MLPIALQAWFLVSSKGDDNSLISGVITVLLDSTARGGSALQRAATASAALVSTSIIPQPRNAETSFAQRTESVNMLNYI